MREQATKQRRGGNRKSRAYRDAENAKWERIFQQKFADPQYYQQVPTLQSSFGSFAFHMEVLCRG